MLTFAVLLPCLANAASTSDSVTNSAQIQEKLDSQLDLTLQFTSKDGSRQHLGDLLIPNRPAIITPVYYLCPRLCTYTLNGMVEAVNEMGLRLGRDYMIISYSINPDETPELAAKKASAYYQELKNAADGEAGWEFLTGSAKSVAELSASLGFGSMRDGADYTHAAAIMVVTPDGRISRYFYGIEFPSADLRRALVEAGQGKIGSMGDRLFLYCFRYDHLTGKYSLLIWNLVRAVSIIGASLLLGLLGFLRISEMRGCKLKI